MSSVAGAPTEAIAAPSFGEALRFWLKLGLISFGGPAGQIAIMHRELVEARRWISDAQFLNALNFCMLLPGPEAQQLATYIGWLKHGTRGGIAAGVLFVLPGFLLITLIALLYVQFRSLGPVEGLLFGLKAAVLAVVVEAVLRLGRRALKSRASWIVAASAFIGIFVFAVPFPVIVLTAALTGFLLNRWRPDCFNTGNIAVSGSESATPTARARWGRILLACGILWGAPILLVHALLGSTHVLALESLFFSKMAVVTFGGAYAVLAYVAQEAVSRYAWLSADDMLQGLALAETTPGPLILVLTFVGFLGAFNHASPFDPLVAGVLGAALTTWVTFVPCFLWIFLGAPHIERLGRIESLSAALSMVTAAVVGVILNLAAWFALHALFGDVTTWQSSGMKIPVPDPASLDIPALAIAIAAAVALLRFKVPMLAVLAMSAGAGIIAVAV